MGNPKIERASPSRRNDAQSKTRSQTAKMEFSENSNETNPVFQDVNLNDIGEDSVLKSLRYETFDFSDLNIDEIVEKVGNETLIVEKIVPVSPMEFTLLEQLQILDTEVVIGDAGDARIPPNIGDLLMPNEPHPQYHTDFDSDTEEPIVQNRKLDLETDNSDAKSDVENETSDCEDGENSDLQNSSDFDYEQASENEIAETSDEEYVPNSAQTARIAKTARSKRITKRPRKYSTDEYTSDSEEDVQNRQVNPLNKTRKPQNRKADNIAHWLFKLLAKNSSAIGWTGRDREFKILDQSKLAKMWGERKGNSNMTYNNVARTMRYHYKNSKGKELEIVNRKLVYRFSKQFVKSRT